MEATLGSPRRRNATVGRGTGQGLSLAYRVITDKHGGRIDVDSEPGEGTCFRIRLPLRQPRDEQDTGIDEIDTQPAEMD